MSTDLNHNSRKAWQTIRKPSNYLTSTNCPCLVNKAKAHCTPTVEGIPSLVLAFSEDEYRKGMAALKYNTEVGIDDVLVEQLKNLGPSANMWLLTMLSKCLTENISQSFGDNQILSPY